MGWKPVVNRFLESPGGDLEPGVPWFDDDIKGEKGKSVMMALGIAPSKVTRVNIIFNLDGVSKTLQLNDGSNVGADDFFSQRLIVPPGASFNLEHVTGTINPSVSVNKEVAD